MTDWELPLFELEECGGDWNRYCEEVYRRFESGMRGVRWHGIKVSRRRAPEVKGKPDGFWHVVTESIDKNSVDREPDLRRCERAHWIGPMIAACGTDRVRCWEQEARRGGRRSFVVATPSFEYAAFLTLHDRADDPYALLKTAYPLRPRKVAKYRREYERIGEYRPLK